MKKAFFLMLALGIAAAVSAEDIAMSAGGGLFFGSDFGGGANYSGDDPINDTYDQKVTPLYGLGFHAFFDYEYVEAGLSLHWGGGKWEDKKDGKPVVNTGRSASVMSINIDALGKYPVDVMENLKAFPLLGLGYHIAVSGKYETRNFEPEENFDGKGGNPNAIDLSALWIKFGGGLDYALGDRLYLRPELTYGIRLSNGYESNTLTKVTKIDENTERGANGDPRLGHGLMVRVGVGYYL
jgi:hypothetical protein